METTDIYNETLREGKSGRFSMVCKKMLIEQRKTIIMIVGAYLGLCVLLGFWFGFMGAKMSIEGVIFYVMIAGLACALVASKMFFDMCSKEGRISLLMLPASPLEKFMSRFIAILPGMILLVIAGYILMDFSNILTVGIKHHEWLSFYNPFSEIHGAAWIGCTFFFSIFLLNESLFVFGSIAWPRKSFIKTLGVFVIIQFLFSLISTVLVESILQTNWNYEIADENVIMWSMALILLLIAAGLFYATYVKFKKASVI